MPFRPDPPPKETGGKKKSSDHDRAIDWPSTLVGLERDFERVKQLYDKYFTGIEKLPPTRDREKVRERIRKLVEIPLRQSEFKFRLQNIVSKVSTYERLWDRLQNQMETGRLKAGALKMSLADQAKRPQPEAPAAEAEQEEAETTEVTKRTMPETGFEEDERTAEVERPDFDRLEPKQPEQRPAPAPRVPMPRPQSTQPQPRVDAAFRLPEVRMRTLFETFIEAKRSRNEPVERITFDSFSASVKKQIPAIMKKHGCRSVDFKVVQKEQGVTLVAVPEK